MKVSTQLAQIAKKAKFDRKRHEAVGYSHGVADRKEGRFFHGYYDGYCYLPLYIFCGRHLLCAKLRTADIDGSAGAQEEVERIVAQLRQSWPDTRIILRGDSGFCREELMSWCEKNSVDYVFGLAKNARLIRAIDDELLRAAARCALLGISARVFKDFSYSTLDSWSRERRVIGKAEHTPQGTNPRFIVTSLSAQQWPAPRLYEELYCARGEMENRIKEAQLDLFADRLSTHAFRGNQLRRCGCRASPMCSWKGYVVWGCKARSSPMPPPARFA